MASKRPGDEDSNGHSAVGDGPDSKKAKSVSVSFKFDLLCASLSTNILRCVHLIAKLFPIKILLLIKTFLQNY